MEVTKRDKRPRRCSNSRKIPEPRIIYGSGDINNNNCEFVDIGNGKNIDKQVTEKPETFKPQGPYKMGAKEETKKTAAKGVPGKEGRTEKELTGAVK